MTRTLFGLVALSFSLFTVGCGVEPVTEQELGEEPVVVQAQSVGPDNKMKIDAFAPVGGSTSYGPILTGYISVTNVGTAACGLTMPTAFGYYPKPDGTQGAVLFQVTSVGPMVASLAPGAVQRFIAQNPTENGQGAVYAGYFEIKVASCAGESVTTNNKATMVQKVIYNPL